MLQEGKAARLRFPEKTGVKAAGRGDSKVLFLALECYTKGLPSSQRGLSGMDEAVDSCAEAAAAAGQLPVLRDMQECGYSCCIELRWRKSFSAAAGGGHMDVVQWLQHLDKGRLTCTDACVGAASGGHVAVLKFLYLRMHIGHPAVDGDSMMAYVRCMQAAAFGGHFEVLCWLRNVFPVCKGINVCEQAAAGGHVKLLCHMHCAWGLSCQPSLRRSGCAVAAARNGHLRVLRWMLEFDLQLHDDACAAAAGGGHIAVLQWLRERGVPWTQDCFRSAIQNGHIHVLQWLLDNGYSLPRDSVLIDDAITFAHFGVLQWLWEHDVPMPPPFHACQLANSTGDPRVIQWVLENEGWVNWRDAACEAR